MDSTVPARRRWHWQIDELEQGPDYVFLAGFRAEDAVRLHDFVREQLPLAYVVNDVAPRPPRYAEARLFTSYVDRHTRDRLRDMELLGTKESIWFHGQIEVFDHELSIKHISAGGMYDDTELIVQLAQANSLEMTYWSVAFSGYEWGWVAQGRDAPELLAYLQAEPPTATASRPPSGVDVNEGRIVRLLGEKPSDHIDVRAGDCVLSISRNLLVQLRAGGTNKWTTDAERLAYISSRRAEKLLAAATSGMLSSIPSDTHHLLLDLFEQGSIYVFRKATGHAIATAHIHYLGKRFGPTAGVGHILVGEHAHAPPWLHIDWWVA